MKIYFATSNKKKVLWAQNSMRSLGVEVEQIDADLIESRSGDPAEIALEKAIQVYNKLEKPVMVEDSGFFIRALNGYPKTYIKFSLDTLGSEGIIKLLEGQADRHAEWRMSLAYISGKNDVHVETMIETGDITHEIREAKRKCASDYWKIFAPHQGNPNKLTLSEFTDEDDQIHKLWWEANNHYSKFAAWLGQKAH